MEWQIIVALVLVIPIILFPAAFVWFLTVGGIYTAVRERQKTREQAGKTVAETGDITLAAGAQPVKK